MKKIIRQHLYREITRYADRIPYGDREFTFGNKSILFSIHKSNEGIKARQELRRGLGSFSAQVSLSARDNNGVPIINHIGSTAKMDVPEGVNINRGLERKIQAANFEGHPSDLSLRQLRTVAQDLGTAMLATKIHDRR
jgi:hypothetical protein